MAISTDCEEITINFHEASDFFAVQADFTSSEAESQIQRAIEKVEAIIRNDLICQSFLGNDERKQSFFVPQDQECRPTDFAALGGHLKRIEWTSWDGSADRGRDVTEADQTEWRKWATAP